jgi:hypothetical protein
MNQRNLFVALVFVAALSIMGCGGTSNVTVTTFGIIIATSGSGQSATVSTSFVPLVATVTTTAGTAASGVTVTFTAPANGASATFPNGNTAVTGANGQASVGVSANGISGGPYTVTATIPDGQAAVHFTLTNTAGAPASIVVAGGSSQNTTFNMVFTNPLVATVTDSDGNPVSGITVTFAAAPAANGASAVFPPSGNTAITGTNGQASLSVSANSIAGGPYSIGATVPGVAMPASFSLTNTETFAFYVGGLETITNVNGPQFYAIAGAFAVNPSTGQITGGEQDYNDANGRTSPQPGGDMILSGMLGPIDTNAGSGTLTLTTNNFNLGANGTETFAVQFVNAKHARIGQFDGTATSSGSMDLQSSTAVPSGGFSFTLSGENQNKTPAVIGGVFIASGSKVTNGVFDENADLLNPVLGQQFSGSISNPDGFGRGTITGTQIGGNTGVVINYYVIGAEAIRIIDVDPFDSAIGSAFGQGATPFTVSSVGPSVFEIESYPFLVVTHILYAAAGMFSTSPATATFAGVGDSVPQGGGVSGAVISGTYSVNVGGVNGYSSLAVTNNGLGPFGSKVLGLYLTDAKLNLNDPNNTTSGLGGALIADMDAGPWLVATGMLVPQTDKSTASFTGNYAFGAQALFGSGQEFDFVGQGAIASGALVPPVTGAVNDPFDALGAGRSIASGSAFFGAAVPDGINPGRYRMPVQSPFEIQLPPQAGGNTTSFDVVIYQASGEQLFMLDEEFATLWLGSIEQQPANAIFPAIRAAPTTKPSK